MEDQQRDDGALARAPELVPGTAVLGLLSAWSMVFHEVGYFVFVLADEPLAELYVQANCSASALGVALGALALYWLGCYGGRIVCSLTTFLGSRGTILAVGVILGGMFWGACNAQWPEAVFVLGLAASAWSTMLLVLCLCPLLQKSISEIAGVCAGAAVVRALFAGVLIPGSLETAPETAPFVLQMTTLVMLVAYLSFKRPDCFAAHDGNLQPLFKKAEAVVKIPQELSLHLFTYFYVLGMMHIFISTVTQAPILSNGVRGLGFLAAAGIAVAAFGRPSSPSFPWPFVRSIAFPLTMLTFLTLPFTVIASSAPVFVVPIFFIQAATTFYNIFSLLLVAYVIRESRKGGALLFLKAVALSGAATLAGVLAGSLIIDTVTLGAIATLCVLTMGTFLVLCVGTFWVGDDNAARKAWGLRPKRSARKFYDETRAERVAELSERYGLTRREREVLLMLAHGKRPNQVADEMVVTINTVRSHIRSIYAKMGLHSSDDLAEVLENKQNG